jgi:hypothetical protein
VPKKVLDVNEKYKSRASDYKKVFNSEAGRRVLHDLLDSHHMLRPTYDAGKLDTTAILIREGERAVVLRILSIMNVDPEKYLQRLEEFRENG